MLGLPQSKKKLRLNRIDFETVSFALWGRRRGSGADLANHSQPTPTSLPLEEWNLTDFNLGAVYLDPFGSGIFPQGDSTSYSRKGLD
ncbi:MAG: hypothetical protein RLZZ435_1413 [Cyanobacteriota bacterium]|jgi:hypothetical protein